LGQDLAHCGRRIRVLRRATQVMRGR
jgi:hypothetical protein